MVNFFFLFNDFSPFATPPATPFSTTYPLVCRSFAVRLPSRRRQTTP